MPPTGVNVHNMKWFALLLCISFKLPAQTWVRISDFPSTKRDDGIAVCVDDKIFFGTGLQEGWTATIDFRVLNTSSNTWSVIPDLPHTRERQYACAFTGSNCFYVFGGYGVGGVLNDLWKYDIGTSSWSAMSSKPGGGVAAAICLQFGNKVIIVSGECGNHYNREVWEYNITSDTWVQKNSIAWMPRRRAGGAVLGGYGYMACGIDSLYHFNKEIYRYDPVTDTWLKLPDIPLSSGRGYASLQAASGKLVLFGGYDSSNVYYNDLWFYKPGTGIWGPENAMPSFGRKGGMSAVVNNVFYYSCGIDATNTRLTETWMLDVPLGLSSNVPFFDNIRVSPCPASESLKIEWSRAVNYEPVLFRITNSAGAECLSINTTTDRDINVPLNELTNGIYQLSIEVNDHRITKRIVVMH